MPKTAGFLLRERFDGGTDASPDGRFTPQAGDPAASAETTGASAGCFGAVGVITYSDLAFAASMATDSAFAFASASLAATGYSTVMWAFIASRARSACARHA